MKIFIKNAFFIFLLSCLGACGIAIVDAQNIITDGVKNISTSFVRGDDDRSFLQMSYVLNENSRLLIRREDLFEKRATMLVDATHPVTLSVHTMRADERDHAAIHLKLCPLNKNWMMLATWDKAHPFGADGQWTQSGGDFATDSCISPTEDLSVDTLLLFDATDLVETHVIGLSEPYGFILISENADVEIAGDRHATKFPRLTWSEVRGFSTLPILPTPAP